MREQYVHKDKVAIVIELYQDNFYVKLVIDVPVYIRSEYFYNKFTF
jgi:hypothetical protein